MKRDAELALSLPFASWASLSGRVILLQFEAYRTPVLTVVDIRWANWEVN